MMLDKIAMILSIECHLHNDDLLLVGVSGGPDSVCLLHVLHFLGYPLIAAHVNHKLRPEADQEAQAVEQCARDLGVNFISAQVDVLTYASEHTVSIEEAARMMRYQSLFEQAQKLDASAVLVAHNADDQLETLLMHLLRGSGLVGMRGMECRTLPNPWSDQIPLLRPFLSTWRDEIHEYLAEHKISFVSDQSNYDTTFLRNRIRHELLPSLEKYNPRIRENLLRMSQINKGDYAVLQQLVNQAWQINLLHYGPGYVAFRLSGFRRLEPSIQRYFLRKAVAYHLPSMRDIDFDSIERGLKFLGDTHEHGQVDLIAGLRLLKEGSVFWLATWQADLPGLDFPAITPGEILTLEIPCEVPLNGDWNLSVTEDADSRQAIQNSHANNDPFQAWLDLDAFTQPLIVRSRNVGERIQPLGMEGHSLKISDLMINLKMPKRARPTWPLVCSGDTVCWVPGCRQSDWGRIKPDSSRIVHLVLRRSSAT